MHTSRKAIPHPRPEAGFTLVELLVSLAVLVVVLLAMLALFDATNKVAHAQTNIAEAQQNVRVAQDQVLKMTRMAARGWSVGELVGLHPNDQILVEDNVGASTYVDGSTTAALKVLPGTDILRLRGVINGSIYAVTDGPGGAGQLEPEVVLDKFPPWSYGTSNGSGGFEQEIDQWQKAKDAGNSFKLLLISRLADMAIAPAKVESISGTSVRLSFKPDEALTSYKEMQDPPDPADVDAHGVKAVWLSEAPHHPIDLVGIVEEYAFYVRENGGHPRLSMARFQPGTNLAYGGKEENLHQDIADDILDLQVAMGIDGDDDHEISADEWWNAKINKAAPYQARLTSTPNLYYLRITTLGRTAGRDFQYEAPLISAIENNNYDEAATQGTTATIVNRSYHRRLLRTVIDVRNL